VKNSRLSARIMARPFHWSWHEKKKGIFACADF